MNINALFLLRKQHAFSSSPHIPSVFRLTLSPPMRLLRSLHPRPPHPVSRHIRHPRLHPLLWPYIRTLDIIFLPFVSDTNSFLYTFIYHEPNLLLRPALFSTSPSTFLFLVCTINLVRTSCSPVRSCPAYSTYPRQQKDTQSP
jgi:hypothetical protein